MEKTQSCCRLRFHRHVMRTMMMMMMMLSLSDATWNLFMNKTETKRLLGINEDVYYVRNGTVNEYALTFNLPLKGHVKDIYFDWNSFEKQEPMYRITLSTSNPSAIEVPILSISHSGRIPTRPSTFGIHLPCSGFVSSEVDIRIHLNITSSVTSNATIIELRRRKTCLMGDTQLLVDDAGRAVFFDSTATPKDQLSSSNNSLILVVIGSTVGLVFVIAIVTVVLYNARKQSRPIGYHLTNQTNCTRISAKDKNGNKSTPASCTRSLLSAGSPVRPLSPPFDLYYPSMSTEAALEAIKPNQISLRRLIMEGSIGRLYYGVLLSDSGEFRQSILVKTINGEIKDVEFQAFMSDVYSLKGCRHCNLQPMLTCLLESLTQPLVVYGFNNDCNLKIYLRTCRTSQVLSGVQLLQMILGICDGLCFLHSRLIIHKDVATRNCLVDDCLTVRLTDSALSSDFFPEDYYVTSVNSNPVPIRWLPMETLEDGVYDMTSEVWSFGVTAWEVMTFGQQPYSEIQSTEILDQLRTGHRLSLPNCSSEEMHQLLMDCWLSQPESRPNLRCLRGSFEGIYANLGQFV